VVFVVATIMAVRLPSRVDSNQGEQSMGFLTGATDEPGDSEPRRPGRVRIPPSMAFALRANCGARWLSGFLTLFMAFLLRTHPINGYSTQVLLVVVIGAAGLGNLLGLAAGSIFKRVRPKVTVVIVLLADMVAVAMAALFYGLLPLAILGLVAGFAQCLAKLSLDSTIQRDVPERVQTSAFARSDTALQLAWVLGGFVGIALPLDPRLGLSVAAVALLAWSVVVLVDRGRRARVVPTAPTPPPAPQRTGGGEGTA
jgi:hypothetical protein